MAMSLRRYRSVREMTGPEPLPPLDPENLRIACELSELAFGLRAWRLEPGLREYVSIEEASRARQAWERDHVRLAAATGRAEDR
jgi:hypothetical protein